MPDATDRNVKLAIDPTVLAYERTYSAWVRTGLGALASGLGVQSLLHMHMETWAVRLSASALIAFSAFCFFAAFSCERRLNGLERNARQLISPALLKLVNGLLLLSSAIAILTVWAV